MVNLRYLTGFTGSSAFAVVGTDVRRFITDFRYVEQAAQQVSGFDRERAPQEYLAALADGWPAGELRVGFEDAHVSVKQHARLAELVPSRVTLVPAGEVVEAERAVKDAGEVELIRAAAAVCDDVYDWLREWGIVGKPEREVAVALEHEMRRRGAEARGGRGRTEDPEEEGRIYVSSRSSSFCDFAIFFCGHSHPYL